jgi:hypothetical protein
LAPPDIGRAQFLVTQSLQKTLVGLAFALAVAGVAPVQLVAGQEAFVTDGARDPPLCENIKDTLGISNHSKTTHTRKNSLQDKTRKRYTSWKNNYNNQH